MKTETICKNCKTHRIIEECTGIDLRRLEVSTKEMQVICEDCKSWVEEPYK
jgi:hypothetical protein